jgi:hypothetical protein
MLEPMFAALRKFWNRAMAPSPSPLSVFEPKPPSAVPPFWPERVVVRNTETGLYYVYDPALNALSFAEPAEVVPLHGHEIDFEAPLPRLHDIDEPLPPRSRPRPPPPLPAQERGEVLHLRRSPPVADTPQLRRLYRELSPCPALSGPQINQAARELKQATAQINAQRAYPHNPYRSYR